ncbi:hypothetical protein PIB30_071721 [Stylosanthes scabra]|uniref:Uncharacterized protein n=1 Tax=Stylosanthes scabra TaxID=79078 RepID=A0ABU6SQ80_9FABA|nr:hypothetical protein [Stylosanthes scabra]
MTPQLTSYVGHTFIQTPLWQRLHVIRVSLTSYVGDIHTFSPNLTEATRYTCEPHVKRGAARWLDRGTTFRGTTLYVVHSRPVGHNLVKEFYANVWEPDKAKRKPYTYTSMVQGKDISFAPSNIKRVLRLRKDPLPNAASYEERKANKDYRLEECWNASALKEGSGCVIKMEDPTS